ncbi:FG-GAP repeat domain-containing protein [Zobellia uliginosa]|uniref:FG-GAP repeat domain-containing protein n=1 Tax=Zobellia uliginosa TaxID=143224 RepID=UPI001C071374|nr:VCBS repeat-containing protein [Zobellia uliginosa]MBU2945743.1 VCBS repeat-containing protein [Zobellia uliginosa]
MKLVVQVFFFLILLISCNRKPKNKAVLNSSKETESKFLGEILSKSYCASCHSYPDPKVLDKNTWKYGVLPEMGFRMGIYHDTPRLSLIEGGRAGELIIEKNIFPQKPVLSEKEWKKIVDYYIENSPDSLIMPQKEINRGISGMSIRTTELRISPPMVTSIKYNSDLNQIYVADAKANYSTINILNQNLKMLSTLKLPVPISDLDYKEDTIYATLIGSVLPSDNPNGSVVKIFKFSEGDEYEGYTPILRNLQRPVHTTFTDINGDGREDIIVCEFGNNTGKLSLFIKNKNGKYDKKILSNDPGATDVIVKDINRDGLLDIVVLMSQGKERIDVYYNQDDTNFKMKTLLSFPSYYGSVSFSIVDWNKDGFEDILYVNGDNADYSVILKPYHGLRIFLNDGINEFNEVFFQHQNGAYKAITHDFDRDGDLDIALASFFPDLKNDSEEGFVFMENVSVSDSLGFDLHTFQEASTGRWLVMEKVDLDNNNFPELILGSFTALEINGDSDGVVQKSLMENSPTVMYLKFD